MVLDSGVSPKVRLRCILKLEMHKKGMAYQKEASLWIHRKSRVPLSAYLRGQRVQPPFFTMEISFNVLKNGRRERGAKCGSILLNFYEIREKD